MTINIFGLADSVQIVKTKDCICVFIAGEESAEVSTIDDAFGLLKDHYIIPGSTWDDFCLDLTVTHPEEIGAAKENAL